MARQPLLLGTANVVAIYGATKAETLHAFPVEDLRSHLTLFSVVDTNMDRIL